MPVPKKYIWLYDNSGFSYNGGIAINRAVQPQRPKIVLAARPLQIPKSHFFVCYFSCVFFRLKRRETVHNFSQFGNISSCTSWWLALTSLLPRSSRRPRRFSLIIHFMSHIKCGGALVWGSYSWGASAKADMNCPYKKGRTGWGIARTVWLRLSLNHNRAFHYLSSDKLILPLHRPLFLCLIFLRPLLMLCLIIA